ncbi:hypothetical protein [Psychromonas ossibalaenae]|uniref:hypothetical protein n=1 Tax=Psychromonas ossibalaenae TaxID=444922 RepID=UPI00035E6935|nr:hypothetical protein [Psychromonas ossibalaenae]
MTFKFLKEDQEVLVHHYKGHDGQFIASGITLIQAGTGLPANSTIEPLPDLSEEQCALFNGNTWEVVSDYSGQMCYAKDRDNGGNYHVTEPGELPDTHTLIKPGEYDSWFDNGWQYDEQRYRAELITQETTWSKETLQLVNIEIMRCQQDRLIPDEYSALMITDYTDVHYYALLRDRKLLHEYPLQDDFPECGRPVLSGIV